MLNPSKHVILRYLENTFPDFEEKSGGEFVGPSKGYDSGQSFWINSNTGLWQDFKNKESGNFWQLISYIEDCSISEAQKKLLHTITAKEIIDVISEKKKEIEEIYKPPNFFDKLDLVPITKESLEFDPRMFRVKKFIYSKDIKDTLSKDFPLYLSVGYEYPNTVIIPFIEKGKMIFFQARTLLDTYNSKYLTPSKETFKVKSRDVLYPFKSNMNVYVTEGPLKARILQYIGINATSTQGASLSLHQGRQLKAKSSSVTLAYDADYPGKKGMKKAYETLVKKLGYPKEKINIAPIPLKGCNDWDDLWAMDSTREKFNKIQPISYLQWTVTEGSEG